MSNETTHPVVKWILIGVIVVSLCVVGACVFMMSYPVDEYLAARELQSRGFHINYEWQRDQRRNYPTEIVGSDRNITTKDSRLICQLPHIRLLTFVRGDMFGLNLDGIGNCQELSDLTFLDVVNFPAEEIEKLAACPVKSIVLINAHLKDSDVANFVGLTELISIGLQGNTGITDASFEYFEKIASLRYLYLAETSVTKEGIEEFKKKRPDVEVIF